MLSLLKRYFLVNNACLYETGIFFVGEGENFKALQQSFKVSIILIEIQPYEEFQLALDIRGMVQPPLKVSTLCLNY